MSRPARLLALVNVRPDESRLVAATLGLALLLSAAGVLTRAAAYALFLGDFSGATLPYTYVGVSLIAPLVTLAYLRLGSRSSMRVATQAGVAFLLLATVAYWAALRVAPLRQAAVFSLPILSGVLTSLAITVYWNLLGRLFTLQQAKRLFSLLNSGDQAAALAGGLLTPALVSWLGTPNLFLAAAVLLLAGWLTLTALGRRYRGLMAAEEAPPATGDGPPPRVPPGRYTRLLFALLALYVVGAYFVSNLFFSQAEAQFADADALAGFLGLFQALSGGLSLILQLAVTSRLLRRYGVGLLLLLTPAAVLLFGAPFAALSALGAAPALLFVLIALAHLWRVTFDAADTAGLNILYQTLPARARTRVQTLMDGILYPLSIGATGVVLLLLINVAGLNQTQLAFILLVVVAVWLAVARALGRAYPQQVQQALRKRLFGEGDGLVLEQQSTAELEHILRDPRPGPVFYALDLLESAAAPQMAATLASLLAHPSALVRAESARRIDRLALSGALPEVAARWPQEPNPTARAALQRTLAHLGDAATAEALLVGLDAAEPLLQQETLLGLLGREDGAARAAALARLHAWADSPDAARRARAAAATAALDPGHAAPLLARLLADGDAAVRHAALRAAGDLGEAALWPRLVAALGAPADAAVAAEALLAAGPPALPALLAALDAPMPADRPRRLRAIKTIGRLGGPAAGDALRRRLPHADFDSHAQLLASLCRAGFRLPAEELAAAITPDVSRAADLLAAWADVAGAAWPAAAERAARLLAAALEQAMAVQRHNLFAWLAFAGDAPLMRQVQFNLNFAADDRSAREQIAYATEIIDLRVAAPVRDWVRPIVSADPPAVRLAALPARFRPAPAGGPRRLATLLDGAAAWLPPWVRACAAYLAGFLDEPELRPAVRAAAEADEPLLAETARRVAGAGRPPTAAEGRAATAAPGDDAMLTTIEKVLLLKSVEFFAGTPDAVLAQMAGQMAEVGVAPGETVIRKGEPGDAMYVVAQGVFRVHVADVTLAWLWETDVFGELALLDGAPRSAAVTAVNDGLLLRLGREAFHELLEDHAEIGRRTLQVMAQRLRLANAQLSALSAPPAPPAAGPPL